MRRRTWLKAIVSVAVAAWTRTGGLLARSAPAGLGLSDAAARRIVDGWLESGYPDFWVADKPFKAATPAARVTFVRDFIAWAKAYTESAAFKTDYEKRRKENAPTPPEMDGTVDDELARQSAERKKSLEEMKKQIAGMPPEMRKSMEAAVKESEAANRKLETDPEMVAMMRQGIVAERAGKLDTHKRRVESHERRFPPNPNTLVARRLEEFLVLSKTVDFDAKLVPAGKLMRFANPEYEQEKPLWKLCYRKGRDVVAAARDSSAAWLKAL